MGRQGMRMMPAGPDAAASRVDGPPAGSPELGQFALQIPGMHLNKLLQVLESRGVSVTHILARFGLDRSGLRQGGSHILYGDYVRLLDCILTEVALPGLGFLAGRHINAADFGVVGYACISAPTWREAISRFIRYQALLGYGIRIRQNLVENASHAVIGAHVLPELPARTLLYLVEEWLGNWSAWLETSGLELAEICLVVPRPDHAALYMRYFSCPVRFSCTENAIRICRSHLGSMPEMANDIAANMMADYCENMLARINHSLSMVERVRQSISAQFRTPPNAARPTLEVVATDLGMGARTLRRMLALEGVRFQDLVNEHMARLAQAMLRDSDRSIKEIGFSLGYTEVSGFHRAFRSWTGVTPGAYREGRDG
ncbi:AraC family transcriptional regulator [Komagataeibacter swingsii]|uniref:AraC family transcriptional regulator n=2 Tax=Komagataeibacter swingsii TaxID=215220 RepID=A0A850P3R2_9PROT|nr:AraC family transcriptional regulator [Komagataeibacter swingsii]